MEGDYVGLRELRLFRRVDCKFSLMGLGLKWACWNGVGSMLVSVM